MKYESPKMEIVRFNLQSVILAASTFITESPVEDNTVATLPDEEFDPFNP